VSLNASLRRLLQDEDGRGEVVASLEAVDGFLVMALRSRSRWEAAQAKAREEAANRSDRADRNLRLYSSECTLCDKQGRVRLPRVLLVKVPVDGQEPVVLAGSEGKVHVWNQEAFAAFERRGIDRMLADSDCEPGDGYGRRGTSMPPRAKSRGSR